MRLRPAQRGKHYKIMPVELLDELMTALQHIGWAPRTRLKERQHPQDAGSSWAVASSHAGNFDGATVGAQLHPDSVASKAHLR